MRSVFTLSTAAACLSLASRVFAVPVTVKLAGGLNTTGFSNPVISQSADGKAVCVTANVPVKASATNTKLNYAMPANQSVITLSRSPVICTNRRDSLTVRSRFFSRMQTCLALKSKSSTRERIISLLRAPVWAMNTNIG